VVNPLQSDISTANPTVFVVDDDPAIRRMVGCLLGDAGYSYECYESAERALSALNAEQHGCLLLDMRMPGMSGTEMQRVLEESGVDLPIIFFSGIADVPATADVMKRGAMDVIQKPCDAQTLVSAVESAIAKDKTRRQQRIRVAHSKRRIQELTPREREVAALMASGLTNKQIAKELKVSDRTVEIHRSRVMSKMQVETIAGFVVQWMSVHASSQMAASNRVTAN
jgi:two-component system, LuxR family, response regulator FixJ